MKTHILALALIGMLALGATPAHAQAAKSEKSGEKKAPAPKTPADLALDEFNKVRNEAGNKDQARFLKVIGAGIAYLTQYPTHNGVSGAVNNLAFYAGNIDRKQPAQRTAYLSLLKLEITNAKYKEGVTDPAKAVLAAVDAAMADFEVREAFGRENQSGLRDALTNLREKNDALAETPGAGRFLMERERSYVQLAAIGLAPARAEEHARKLLEHPEKGVKDMAREELNILEAKKEPYALKFTALDGKEIDFAQLRGKVVAMYFWSSTHKGSTDRLEPLKQIHSDYRKRGFEVVTVSFDKPEDREQLMKFVKDKRIAWPVYYDGKMAKNDFSPKLNITSVPRLLVFDQKGMLQTTIQGAPVGRLTPDLPQNQLEGVVKRLLGIK